MAALVYLFSLIGLGASSILSAEYLRGMPIFCAAGSGCDIVRASSYAEILGVKTPFFGVVFFAVALVLALWPARRLLVAWSVAGALAGLAFIAIQAFVLKAFCPYCLAADGSAVLLLGAAFFTRRELRPPRTLTAVLVGLASAAAVVGPLSIRTEPPEPVVLEDEPQGPTPQVILDQQKAGVTTIIEFVDFECPYCRKLHRNLKQTLGQYGDKVRVIRKHMPIPSIHKNAMPAALAACCAEEAGFGEKMADALFSAPPDELDAAGCERIAVKVGVEVERYRECMSSDRPKKKLEAHADEARLAGLEESVPVMFIGPKVFHGALSAGQIRAAIDRELARQ